MILKFDDDEQLQMDAESRSLSAYILGWTRYMSLAYYREQREISA